MPTSRSAWGVRRGGLRRGLPAGALTRGPLFDVFPFDNRIATLAMTGAQLRQALARQMTRSWRRDPERVRRPRSRGVRRASAGDSRSRGRRARPSPRPRRSSWRSTGLLRRPRHPRPGHHAAGSVAGDGAPGPGRRHRLAHRPRRPVSAPPTSRRRRAGRCPTEMPASPRRGGREGRIRVFAWGAPGELPQDFGVACSACSIC